MFAMLLCTKTVRMTFITTTPSFQQIFSLCKILYLQQLSPASVHQSWKSFFAIHSFHHVNPTVQAEHSYHVNGCVTKLTRVAGKSLTWLAFDYLTVTLFTQETPLHRVFVKSRNGQDCGPRNSDQNHIVSNGALWDAVLNRPIPTLLKLPEICQGFQILRAIGLVT